MQYKARNGTTSCGKQNFIHSYKPSSRTWTRSLCSLPQQQAQILMRWGGHKTTEKKPNVFNLKGRRPPNVRIGNNELFMDIYIVVSCREKLQIIRRQQASLHNPWLDNLYASIFLCWNFCTMVKHSLCFEKVHNTRSPIFKKRLDLVIQDSLLHSKRNS